ncbi:MAG: L,D-transpeptidase family protein [Chitinophagales bacterium]|nr:L,D-transpeptidase family protein [Chitinophagales bacterium]
MTTCVATRGQTIMDFNKQLHGSDQVLFVVTPNWASARGTMSLYERKEKGSKWKCVITFPVTVGKNGLAWDPQTKMQKFISAKAKHEGDGNSPAGIFTLGPVFSYYGFGKINMPFKQVEENDICVDDVKSKHYNTLIDTDSIKQQTWDSFEHMKRTDSLYEYGVWVNYNSEPSVRGNGSCIFLHIWKDETSPTSGCTAMSKENMLKVIYWLNQEKNPVLLQVSVNK